MQHNNHLFHTLSAILLLFWANATFAQNTIPFNDLSFWKPTNAKNWQIAGGAQADLVKDHVMTAAKGTGVLVNLPNEKNRANLISVAEFGDSEISFDFMMAKYSNSGFYLQGRYEVQLLDSWGRKDPAYNDCGGIFPRRRFEPQEELFEGHAPLINASLAPGLWQHMEITFRAPRFDASGKKTANARMVAVRLNGVLVQDNVELTGPTGGPISEQEATKGPIMIQGDHGQIAFRNLQIIDMGDNPVKMENLRYSVVYGQFRDKSEFKDKKPDLMGTSDKLTYEVAKKEDGFANTYFFNLDVPVAGKHEFILQTGGNSILTVNGETVLPQKWGYSTVVRTGSAHLPKGKVPVELTYFKMDNWMPPMLALTVKGADASVADLHTLSSTLALVPPDPIYLDAKENTVFRSFMDYYEDQKFVKRIVHPAHVGTTDRLHFTYDLDNGALAQAWRGHFLNTSPMWDNRGDGSSQPRGMVLPLGDRPTLVPMDKLTDTSTSVMPALAFRTLGYDLEDGNMPDFRYSMGGTQVRDRIRPMDASYLRRTIELDGTPTTPLYCRLAMGTSIQEVGKGLYSVDDFGYFIRLPKGVTPQVVRSNGYATLYVPAIGSITYDIVF
jgi:hypothetical protein